MTRSAAAPSVSFDFGRVDRLTEQFAEWAADTYADGGFPHREIAALRNAGLLYVTLPGQPLDLRARHTATLLQLLQRIGKGNLSVGRIYEGHVNALHLIGLYATPHQQERWFRDARNGHLFGVWNTQMHDGIRLYPGKEGHITIGGAKSFCSGSVHVTRALITGNLHTTAGDDRGWQMAIVPLDDHCPPVDEKFWKPTGMRNSVSHKIEFTGIDLAADDLLGDPDDYSRQPSFSGGAIRFAAVQLGGAEAILDACRDHLRSAGRTGNGYQRTRIGQLAIAVESGKLWLKHAGQVADDPASDPGQIVHTANMTRTAIAGYCDESLKLAEKSLGAAGMLHPHPFARLHADLNMYLRQPAPDAVLEAIGQQILDDYTTD
ncbi:alkylation response protein AidB-like acyl-CoA dehydrogenase [Lewinella aquimaris]|uniref:Alkylation response protein AidB-like acyl-CoA dehydrogenase n=1 Tax=Neolewinella aquimaris TaxID=1835722 RepID=A0A840E669_9BACT|nr:acyl-CoA dehydrogenase family protein [Neolewinella aquimaris]MBB4079212.1 alkylation response protein AidB-like acyl-CoA dehydrogenase [Neolewinella aquimaris]